jgi:hypothetical protein
MRDYRKLETPRIFRASKFLLYFYPICGILDVRSVDPDTKHCLKLNLCKTEFIGHMETLEKLISILEVWRKELGGTL